MQILSHRGYWGEGRNKNTIEAFNHSFVRGYGTETDFRDLNGRLVVSHDPPIEGALTADDFFGLIATVDPSLPVAINIKSDGIQDMVLEQLEKFGISNYFLFDMSIPDALASISKGLKVFTRQSDVEPDANFYDDAEGVWMDSFHDDSWITEQVIQSHLDANKKVCVVSPELHGRPHQNLWDRLRDTIDTNHQSVMLCTDIPDAANKFLNP